MFKIGDIYEPLIGDGYKIEIMEEPDLLTDTVKVRYADYDFITPFHCSVETLCNNYKLVVNGQTAATICEHKWLVYYGFYDAFEYCEKCDVKRPLK